MTSDGHTNMSPTATAELSKSCLGKTKSAPVYPSLSLIDPDTWATYSGTKVHWIRYFFGRTLSGTLRIRGDKYEPFVVDAIAVEH